MLNVCVILYKYYTFQKLTRLKCQYFCVWLCVCLSSGICNIYIYMCVCVCVLNVICV